MTQRIIRQCVLVALITAALVLTFAPLDTRLPLSAWIPLTILSESAGILLWAVIFNPRAPWSTKNT